jgi:hypothetical protein
LTGLPLTDSSIEEGKLPDGMPWRLLVLRDEREESVPHRFGFDG